MKFFLISSEGLLLSLARLLQAEGHEVQLHVVNPGAKSIGKGIVPLAPGPYPPEGATVIFDGVGKGHLGQALRRRGFAVIGGNPLDQELEIDRTSGTRLMQISGIRTPETKTFKDLADARAYLATHRGTFFFKPSGNRSTQLTHSGESDELRRWLRWAQGQFPQGLAFELQRKVRGIEVSTEGWFDGEKWILPFNSTFEEKTFLAGDLGPRTGCEANVVWAWPQDRPPLIQNTVLKVTALLRQAKYVGPIDLNGILDDESGEPIGLEWSARFGFDALYALSMLVEGNFGEQLALFARGRLKRWDLRTDTRAMTLRVTTPPYPVESAQVAQKMRGLPLDPHLLDDPRHVFVTDVMADKDGEPALAGWDGYVCCVGGLSPTFAGGRKAVLALAKSLKVPEKQYRIDPLEDAEKRWEGLRRYGYDVSEPPGPSQRETNGVSRGTTDQADSAISPPPPPPMVDSGVIA